MCVCVCVCVLMQVLKTMERRLFITFNCNFSSLLDIFLCRDPGGKGIVLYLLPKRFQTYF